jgi:hypothetical protein
VKYRICQVRGYWEARDSKGRLVSLAFQLSRLHAKLRLWREIDIADNNNRTKDADNDSNKDLPI